MSFFSFLLIVAITLNICCLELHLLTHWFANLEVTHLAVSFIETNMKKGLCDPQKTNPATVTKRPTAMIDMFCSHEGPLASH